MSGRSRRARTTLHALTRSRRGLLRVALRARDVDRTDREGHTVTAADVAREILGADVKRES